MDIEMATFLNPLQTFSNGRFQAAKYQAIMAPEYKQAMSADKSCPDIRVSDRAYKFEQEVRDTFAEIEKNHEKS